MATVDRQNSLIAAEDWKRIYLSFKNADFQSYDFDNLRRTMVSYLRENYPEDFNDYIESSEYLALIDLIAFLGQNLAFRFDLNARDNFLELADRRESVLRLARLLSYNAKRNQCANGLLKFTSVSTTEDVIDSNGRNLSKQTVLWNDSSNINWPDQFNKILNAALLETSQIGKPQDKAIISGIPTEQYRVSGTNTEVPLYSFNKNIDGRNMDFEVVSSSFKNSDKIYEEAPFPGARFAFLYRNDGGGHGSSNNGFFAYFKQGSLQESTFAIARPSPNEIVDVDSQNINNDDIWLYNVDSLGNETTLWNQVSAVVGSNIIYNSLSKSIRKIYAVLTRVGDRVRIVFADGVFGDLPQGSFKIYYRVSNGLRYSINPTDIRNVSISIPYISKTGKNETLSVVLGLKYTVSNATTTESSTDIKNNAPAVFYSQGRMITGEDYSVLPLSISQDVIKVKAINRVSSGISRYFDFKDASGKYSTTNIFGNDGVIYKEPITSVLNFSVVTQHDVENAVTNKIEPFLSAKTLRNFYLDEYTRIDLSDNNYTFTQVTNSMNLSTGVVKTINGTDTLYRKLGEYTGSELRYIVPGSLVRFVPEEGKVFTGNNAIIDDIPGDSRVKKHYIWSTVVKVVDDGTGNNTGVLDNGYGPLSFNDIIPSGAKLDAIYPKFNTKLEKSVIGQIQNLILAHKDFGLRYDLASMTWKIIHVENLSKRGDFSLDGSGNNLKQQSDSSWFLMVETNGEVYTITVRGTRYVFESEQEVRFFFDSSEKVFDAVNGRIIKDVITILNVNTQPDAHPQFNVKLPLGNALKWEVVDEYKGADGYVDSKKISVGFLDSDNDGVDDDCEIFNVFVNPQQNPLQKYIFVKRQHSDTGIPDYYYFPNNDLIKVYRTQRDANADVLLFEEGQLVYIVSANVVKQFSRGTQSFEVTSEYKGYVGRSDIKFNYIHAANSSSRIDPSSTNMIDMYLLTRTYDTAYRRWLRNEVSVKPTPPTSDELYLNFHNGLKNVKALSDEIVYHSVKYKNLFGAKADSSLQATLKIIKSTGLVISDNDIKSGVITAMNEFFSVENWDFGDNFYFAEMVTYIMTKMTPSIANIVIVPKQQNLVFGSLFEINANADEIFVSSATVDDIEIISEITAAQLKANGMIITTSNF